MTNYTRKQIQKAIAECDRYIAKEGARSADLRPADVAVRLEWYKSHRAKLIGMLVENLTAEQVA